MVILRKEQMALFNALPRLLFEKRLIRHFFRFYERECKDLGEDQVHLVIKYGIEKAEKYGYSSQRDIGFFISLMFLFGSGFDNDPQLPWAKSGLEDASVEDTSDRIGKVWSNAMLYIDTVAGESNEHLVVAMKKLRDYDFSAIRQMQGNKFKTHANTVLTELYPTKCEYHKEEITRQLVLDGMATAKSFGLEDNESVIMFLILKLFLGGEFYMDPLYPWISAILNDDTLNSVEKSQRLNNSARQYLSKALTQPLK